MIILRAIIDKLNVIVLTDCGRFTCGPDGFVHGPDIRPGAARQQIAATIYWEWFEKKGDWTFCPPERVKLAQPWLDVSPEWCAHLDEIYKAASATGNFNR